MSIRSEHGHSGFGGVTGELAALTARLALYVGAPETATLPRALKDQEIHA